MFYSAIAEWDDFLGYCLNRGLGDPRDMYLDQFYALVWHLFTKDLEEGEREVFKAKLWIPPPGVEIDERNPWHPDNQLKSLKKAQGAAV